MATWDLSDTKYHILICNGSSCNKAGAETLTQSIRNELYANDLDSKIHTTRTLCNGRCHDKCVVITYPDGNWYKDMTSEDASLFVESLVAGTTMEYKLSHTYFGNGFERTEGTIKGVERDVEKVERVSKKL
ncbi:(2Fe-2S) ferredoxin domain-containing protein [Halalkalibacter krulwichiae]|uniref:Ferredoxin, 2Fe-2S n=1 Tax=Halalkalibacter krulwichiae TaxID=199441 RepID=A0A1X9MEN1_9BACI|nr:(2Fe-2S) ferredoxin domain-containing protein [Halalkalibacter krulwichiae]ARK29991.1 Ferredoxin, 2Fe-2S [Halalkalibacter krulwichiae]